MNSGCLVCFDAQRDRASAAGKSSGLPFKILDRAMDEHLCIGTMHLAKALEFRAVAVMACDDEILSAAGKNRNRRVSSESTP